MKKEYLLVLVIALFVLSSVLDSLSGPLKLALKNPFYFLKPAVIAVYPFTAVSIGMKTTFLFISALLALSVIEKKYLAKGVFLLFLSALLELYSIQQIATGSQRITLEWSIALAFSGVALILPAVLYFVMGIIKLIHSRLKEINYPYSQEQETEEDL